MSAKDLIGPEFTGEVMNFIAYDVESENSKHLKPSESDWLRDMRVEIWYELRYRLKCVPIQNSLWLIRDEKALAKLQKLKDQWLAQYKKGGFHALIQIFPIQTNDAGKQTFKQWEFEFILDWLGKIEKALVKAHDLGKATKKALQGHTKKLDLLQNILREDFDDTYPSWQLAQDIIETISDLLGQCAQDIGIDLGSGDN